MTAALCDAPEAHLLLFLLAGTLSPEERAAVLAHATGCPVCSRELAAGGVLVTALREAHLMSEEIVQAAWDGGYEAHLAACAPCRGEVLALREGEVKGLQELAAAADEAPDRRRARPRFAPFAAAASVAVALLSLVLLYRSGPPVDDEPPYPPVRWVPTDTAVTAPTVTTAPTPIATATGEPRTRAGTVAGLPLREVQHLLIEISGSPAARELQSTLSSRLAAGTVWRVTSDPNMADAVLRATVVEAAGRHVRMSGARLVNAAGTVLWSAPRELAGPAADLAARVDHELRKARMRDAKRP